jgi:hypothetical protein
VCSSVPQGGAFTDRVFGGDLPNGGRGWVIDWNKIDVQTFAHARTVAIHKDEQCLDALLYPSLNTVAEAAAETNCARR